MSRQVQLSVTATVVLTGEPGAATGTVSIGPTGVGEVWEAGYTAAVSTAETAITSEAVCRVQCAGRLIGATTWGSTGDATTNTLQLTAGQVITATWTGGDPGATAVLDLTGTRTTG